MARYESQQRDGQERVGRHVKVKVEKRMNQDRDQPESSAQNK